MWAAIKLFASTNWMRLVQLAGLATAAAALFYSVRKGGSDAEKNKQLARSVENAHAAAEVRTGVDAIAPDVRREWMREQWSDE